MIKFIGAAVWICLVTLGAVFYSFKTPHPQADAASPPPLLGGLKYVKTNVITVPLFNKAASVEGYFLARLVYTADPKELKKLTVPVDSLITDQVYTYLYANPEIDYSKRDNLDLDAFRNGIRETVNSRIGQEMIHDVIVEQIDFLNRDETRDRAVRRRNEQADAAAATAPDSAEH
ncbi:hypothetical protein [Pseudaminobacter soli (ex Li et al. 2025)]|uniref:hypothetical protein n=1 Tax=Pseudaminobacter soli (ex Li et al. 2025) TaxID=1295366 RepID=UPI0015E69C5F|nr:hypothetical protein [Mesorhizobium soli]